MKVNQHFLKIIFKGTENNFVILGLPFVEPLKVCIFKNKFLKCSLIRGFLKLIFVLIFIIINASIIFASPYTICNGKEFNRRVKMFLSGGDSNWDKEYSITIFERGNNPPSDRAYYVDISEDNDGTVIAYAVENELYYYSDSSVVMNENCAYMFDKFIRIRNIDLSGFTYFDIKDTRYMFASCHHLKTLKFKGKNANKKNIDRKWELGEMQGMFFDCQSLVNVDLSRFDTRHVYNMNEVFYKCYNIKNIYVDAKSWIVEDANTCENMFALCHVLKTNKGRMASDVSEDEYLQYAIAGSGKEVDYDKKVEGFLKDINTEYEDYGERDGSAPIDGDDYYVERTSPTITYSDEPEGDEGFGLGGSGTGDGVGNGGNVAGYGEEKEEAISNQILIPTEFDILRETTNEVIETSIVEQIVESSPNINIIENTTNITTENVINETTKIIVEEETTTISNNNIENNENKNSKRVIDLDEYLREQGIEGKGGVGNGIGGQGENEDINYQFLIFAIIILTIAILLLIGVVLFLVEDKHENIKQRKQEKEQEKKGNKK